jgi:hypothetical protein
MPCQFPEHHGRHGSAGLPAGAVAAGAATAAAGVCVSHASGITEALVVVLVVLGVLAVVGVAVLVWLLSGSRSAIIPPPALPPAKPRNALYATSAIDRRGRLAAAPPPARAITAPPAATAEILAREDVRHAPRPEA